MCISVGVFVIKDRKKADLDRPLRTKLLLLGQISMSVLRSSFRRVAGRFLVTRYGNLQIPCAREIVLIGSTGKIWRPFGPVELELSFQFFSAASTAFFRIRTSSRMIASVQCALYTISLWLLTCPRFVSQRVTRWLVTLSYSFVRPATRCKTSWSKNGKNSLTRRYNLINKRDVNDFWCLYATPTKMRVMLGSRSTFYLPSPSCRTVLLT